MRALMLATALTLAAVGAVIGVAVATHSNSVDVRVAARSTESDSIEFAIQQRLPDGSWSDYRYGRARFFGPSLHDGRWKHATPVQVEVPAAHASTPTVSPTPTETAASDSDVAGNDGSIERTQQSWYFIDPENNRIRGCRPLNDDNDRLRLSLKHDNKYLSGSGDTYNPRPPGPNDIGWCYKAGGIIGEGYEHTNTSERAYLNKGWSGHRVGNLFVTVSTADGYFFIGCREYWLNDENIRTITRSQCDFIPRRGTSSGIDLTHYDDRYGLHEVPNNLLVNGGTNTLCVDTQVVDEQYWIDRSISENNRTLSLARFIREHMDEIPVERFCFDFKVVW